MKYLRLFGVVLLLFYSSENSSAQEHRLGGPPPQATAACESKKENSTCSFYAPHGSISGVCLSINRGSLACVPSEMMNNKSSGNNEGREFNSNSAMPPRQKMKGQDLRINISAKTRTGNALKNLIPDTNQGSCFNNTKEISCPKENEEFFGQDGNYFGATPRYYDNKDGTVSDLVTNLMWQKAHNSKRLGFYEAKKACETLQLGGFDDWRLPSIKELFSLADFRGTISKRYYIDTSYFELKEASDDVLEGDRFASVHQKEMMGQTWSSTIYQGNHYGRNQEAAFFFNFFDGHIKNSPTTGHFTLFYRCVRGSLWGENKFVDNQNGTVTDQASKLTWQQKDDGRTRDWKSALQYCQDLKLGGSENWRLPSVKELQSIVDYSRKYPALDTRFLKLSDNKAWFWSSTTHGDNIHMANYVCFGACLDIYGKDNHGCGGQRSDPKAGSANGMSLGGQEDEVRINNYVRCVH